MKTSLKQYAIFLTLIAFSQACLSSSEEAEVSTNYFSVESGRIRSSAEIEQADIDYAITEDDIAAYIRFKQLAAKCADNDITVSPLPGNGKNVEMYVINYPDSFEVISADKRMPIVLASGSGSFTDQDNNSSSVWLESIVEELKFFIHVTGCDEEYAYNIKTWKLINADKDILGKPRRNHRSGPDTTDHPVPGHYELYNVEYDEIILSSIPHLVGTKWWQDYPYNYYCPKVCCPDYISNYVADPELNNYDDLGNCLTGCVAVAGGQFLYYYNLLGDAGDGVFDSAYCHTFQYPFTDWAEMHQHNFSWSNWYKFHTADSLKMIAILLANIGESMQSIYGYPNAYCINKGTSARITALDSCLNDIYGVDCDVYSFNDGSGTNYYDYIYELLCNEHPSIISASPADTVGHAFIIDRYKNSFVRTFYYYRFIPDDPSLSYNMFEEVDYSEDGPVQRFFGMNWGFGGQGDNTWYISTGPWFCGGFVYSIHKKLLVLADALP